MRISDWSSDVCSSDLDGRLSFEEWAIATSEKFARADADTSGKLTRAEFATTRRKTKPKPKCVCSKGDEERWEDKKTFARRRGDAEIRSLTVPRRIGGAWPPLRR